MEAADNSEEGAGPGPTSGPIAYGAGPAGFHTKTYPVYQAHQTQSQWLAPHLSAATVITTAYWMFQYAWSTERAMPVASAAGGGRRRSAAGGARAAQIGPEIGKYTISVYPDIV